MKLLTIIDTFYTQTLRGFLSKYSYEQGITGYLGLSFLSGTLLALRRLTISIWETIADSLFAKITVACLGFALENIMKLAAFSGSILSTIASKVFSHSYDFATGPGKEFTTNTLIPAIKAEASHLKNKPIIAAIGCALFLSSASDLFNLVFRHNQDQSRKYTYPEVALLTLNGSINCAVMSFTAISLITPVYKVDTGKMCILLTGLYFFNKFTQSTLESSSRS